MAMALCDHNLHPTGLEQRRKSEGIRVVKKRLRPHGLGTAFRGVMFCPSRAVGGQSVSRLLGHHMGHRKAAYG
jgi:hypothetical protein